MKKLVFTFICLIFAVLCQAQIITVDNNGPADFNNIQSAINNATNGDIVIVAPGTYTGPGNRNIDFLGKAITVRSTNPNEPNIVTVTVIDCGTAGRGFYFHNGEGLSSVVAGVTVTKGFANRGGGILCENSSPNINNCIISGNSANENGGGICCYSDGSPTISYCVITGNKAGNGGGGISCMAGSHPIIEDCTFSSNSATTFGAGMQNIWNSDPSLFNCIFSKNIIKSDSGSGGGMGNYYNSDPEISNCSFSDNSAPWGGGICNDQNSKPTISTCIIRANRATVGGGGISNSGSSPIITNCIFSGNRASHVGGGINNQWNSNVTLSNCVFHSNIALWGGGAFIYYSSPALINCTFAKNSILYGGGGYALACDDAYNRPSSIVLTNCILWDYGNEIWNKGQSIITITYSDVKGGWAGEGNIEADPLFINLAAGDYHLLGGSPCIDAGDNTAVPPDTQDLDDDEDVNEPIPFDLDGNPRFVDLPYVPDTGNGMPPIIDMGAYEAVKPPINVPMKFTPQALNPESKGNWIKAHFVLPEGFEVNAVDVNSPAEIWPLGIESDYINVFINEDGLVEIEIGFDRANFCSAGIDYGPAEVTVIGKLMTGQNFYGTDTIRIINNNLKYLAVLSFHWLEAGCGVPDWCGGADLNQSNVVDFIDFALYDGCCIEVVKQ